MPQVHGRTSSGNLSKSTSRHFLVCHHLYLPFVSIQLQCSHYVSNWGYEIQTGLFDMVELLIDLVAARLAYFPVPVRLLESLAIVFDCESVFQRKHRTEPYDRTSHEKQLGDRMFTVPSPSFPFSIHSRADSYGWLCAIINRFVLKDGIVNLKRQFQTENPLTAAVRTRDVFLTC